MASKIPFLKVHLRAMAQATEIPERVGQAMEFVSGTDEISYQETKGHFGNQIIIFEVELSRASEIKSFLLRLKEAGILERVEPELEQRLDEDCNLHLRLDKQKAFLEEVALASDKDVVAVTMKVAAYPARRENALLILTQWFSYF